MIDNFFFIVGAQRSGTTYLYTILDEHPEICMAKPVRPEPKYFLNNHNEIFNKDDYMNSYYKEATKNIKCFGEKSTSYYENKKISEYLSKNIPNAKIIFILADPVLRAISNYKFSCDNGLEDRTLSEVFLDNKHQKNVNFSTSVNPFAYKERGEYYKYLDYYHEYFPKENIQIIVKENFTNNLNSIQQLYKFLNVRNDYVPTSINAKINKSALSIKEDELELVYRHLSNYYKEHNRILETKYNLDISKWK